MNQPIQREMFRHRFVPYGATAPEDLPAGEMWLDVGNRIGPGVLDHHSGNTEAQCAAELVVKHWEEYVVPRLVSGGCITLVMHTDPDLDALFSAWLVIKGVEAGPSCFNHAGLRQMLRQVGDNDQGRVRTTHPGCSWPIALRLLIESTHPDSEDCLSTVFGAINATLDMLDRGMSLEVAADVLHTPSTRAWIDQADRDYQEDISRAIFFQCRLPVHPLKRPPLAGKIPVAAPSPAEARWAFADGLVLKNPTSRLFKELARSDAKHSPSGHGFALMVVVGATGKASLPGIRYIISTDPLTGLHLQGLGLLLEQAEQEKEDREHLPLPPGRERVPVDEGRHGYRVKAPWYDGRGHDFTIVDCPAFEVDGRRECLSRLSLDEVLDIIWRYGDPGRFVHPQEAELVLLAVVEGDVGWEKSWQTAHKEELADLYPDVVKEGGILGIYRLAGEREVGPFRLGEQRLWEFASGKVWMGRFSWTRQLSDLSQFSADAVDLTRTDLGDLLPLRLHARSPKSFHLAFLRLDPQDIALHDRTGPSATMMHLLASAYKPTFGARPHRDELEEAKRILSRDHLYLVMMAKAGLTTVSVRSQALELERDFHHPRRLSFLAAFTLAQHHALDRIANSFAEHGSTNNPWLASDAISQDRAHLITIENSLFFSRITDVRFGQQVYEAIRSCLAVQERYQDIKCRIETLTEQVHAARSNFYERVTFWASILLMPLVMTAGLFSGSQLQRGFPDSNVSLVPTSWSNAGWLNFLLYFIGFSALGLVGWWVVRRHFLRGHVLRDTRTQLGSVQDDRASQRRRSKA